LTIHPLSRAMIGSMISLLCVLPAAAWLFLMAFGRLGLFGWRRRGAAA